MNLENDSKLLQSIKDSDVLVSISLEMVQSDALAFTGRELTDEEIVALFYEMQNTMGHMYEWIQKSIKEVAKN